MQTAFSQQRSSMLFTPPGTDTRAALHQALAATARAFPLTQAHRRELPAAIRELSGILTAERGALSRSYWASPKLLGAYLHYFLPWNLYRLSWLLPNLDFSFSPGSRILDLGSGPLTLPLALWCARPELRELPLEFICADIAVRPLETGKAIFTALAGKDSPWRFTLQRAPLEKALRLQQTPVHCITAANILNELADERCSGQEEFRLADRLGSLIRLMANKLENSGKLLLVEPGTRLGGKLIALCRQELFSCSLSPLAPCTHACGCPMLSPAQENGREEGTSSGRRTGRSSYTGWCHFTLPAHQAPEELQSLSQKALRRKAGLSLSCLFAGKQATSASATDGSLCPGDELEELERLYEEILGTAEVKSSSRKKTSRRPSAEKSAAGPGRTAHSPRSIGDTKTPMSDPAQGSARILSAPIRLPGQGNARYACTEKGLALLLDTDVCHSGSAVIVTWPTQEVRDEKTGALLLRAVRLQTKKPGLARPGQKRQHAASAKGGRGSEAAQTGKNGRPDES